MLAVTHDLVLLHLPHWRQVEGTGHMAWQAPSHVYHDIDAEQYTLSKHSENPLVAGESFHVEQGSAASPGQIDFAFAATMQMLVSEHQAQAVQGAPHVEGQ